MTGYCGVDLRRPMSTNCQMGPRATIKTTSESTTAKMSHAKDVEPKSSDSVKTAEAPGCAPNVRSDHSYLIASIGESLEARLAGNTPNTIPIPEDTPSASATDSTLISAGKKL